MAVFPGKHIFFNLCGEDLMFITMIRRLLCLFSNFRNSKRETIQLNLRLHIPSIVSFTGTTTLAKSPRQCLQIYINFNNPLTCSQCKKLDDERLLQDFPRWESFSRAMSICQRTCCRRLIWKRVMYCH